jgi:uncharacterized protein YecE (DUF72 family)
MEFGKLPSIDGVNFALPPDPPENALLFERLPTRNTRPHIYLGATGYHMREWVGAWYPAGAKERSFLAHYGHQFATIEHNTTHYRIPDSDTIARWIADTPADFSFCPKVPQTISHARDLGLNSGQLGLFVAQMEALLPRLGSCFMQMPPHFDPAHLPALHRFLERWPTQLPLAVEVRHPAFFAPVLQLPLAGLDDFGAGWVITDVAGRRDVCHMYVNTPRVLIRFVGNDLHATDYQRIRDWAARLRKWFDAGLQAVYFFTHEPDNLKAPDLAAFCADVFSQAIPDAVIRGPERIEPPPVQGTLF